MAGSPSDGEASQELAAAHLEVEFALVLARTIDLIKADPKQFRGAIYELARQKLREQFTHEDPSQIARLTAALEVAIQGVEAHSKKEDERPRAISSHSTSRSLLDRRYPATIQVLEPPGAGDFVDRDVRARPPLVIANSSEKFSSKRAHFAGLWRSVIVIGALLAIVVITLQRSGNFTGNKGTGPIEAKQETLRASKTDIDQNAAAQPSPEAQKVSQLLPTSFGIYAVSGEKLYELEPLQGRAPDIRVAVSAAITMPSRTILPDGNLRFIVFRRDGSGNVPDQVDVRIVAKIEQAMNFDAAGKPVISKADDNWVIRNISFPYRTAPIKDNPEMYEVQSKDLNVELTPGRYALVIKGHAFDFTVAGNVTDTRQCLGRVSASNGTFYSECQKLQ
jgi:hypothetical protein